MGDLKRGPWLDLTAMTEVEFIVWLVSRLEAEPPTSVTIHLVDLELDIVLPKQMD